VLQVKDLRQARRFYRDVLGGHETASDESSLTCIFYGHRLICRMGPTSMDAPNHPVVLGRSDIPITACNLVLDPVQWRQLLAVLRRTAAFRKERYVLSYDDFPGERASLSFVDPSGNVITFKLPSATSDQLHKRRNRYLAVLLGSIIAATLILASICLQVGWTFDSRSRWVYYPPPPCMISESCRPTTSP